MDCELIVALCTFTFVILTFTNCFDRVKFHYWQVQLLEASSNLTLYESQVKSSQVKLVSKLI